MAETKYGAHNNHQYMLPLCFVVFIFRKFFLYQVLNLFKNRKMNFRKAAVDLDSMKEKLIESQESYYQEALKVGKNQCEIVTIESRKNHCK